jgi:hypothetical protein
MGWKAACILAGDCPAGYLGSLPTHEPTRADKVIAKLGYAGFEKRERTTIEVYPEEKTFIIGAYDQAVFLADRDLIFNCFEDRKQELFQRALSLYPSGKLLMVVLHSVVNYFGYAYYENGELLREFSGGADQGVISDVGELQPEERPAFENSEIKDGERVFYDQVHGRIEEFSVDCYGEELTFQMMSKFFGHPFDRVLDGENDHNDLEAEVFYKTLKKSKPWWKYVRK